MEHLAQQPDKDILRRMDQLKFSKWHLFMILSLGLVWIFDGYEASLISLFRKYIVQQYDESAFLSLATSYQVGCIIGSLIFGVCGFVLGRKKIFIITLIIYAIGIAFSIISDQFMLFLLGRFFIGIRYLFHYLSIGGQFTAIFTAIDEFLPPQYRGRVNIGIDGTWHLGGSLAAALNIIIGEVSNWRYLFTVGLLGILALLLMRRNIPQSPRWLILKKNRQQADLVVKSIEAAVQNKKMFLDSVINLPKGQLNIIDNELVSSRLNAQDDQQEKKPNQQKSFKQIFYEILSVIIKTSQRYKSRLFLAVFLMFTQAFFFNLVYYKFPATLQNIYHLGQDDIFLYMLPLSLSSFASTIVVGPLFDKIGRKQLLLITFGISGILLIFAQFIESLLGLEIAICLMFCFTAPAGSSANLIASEIFPTSSRTLILFIMFIVGMVGGIMGVWVNTVWIGSILAIIAGILGYYLCPKSQNKSLQQIENL